MAMPTADLLKEADRISTICNACRYCEGFCAVFPAIELRRTFTEQDLKYFANLCHNCRDCYYACQYAPPHEFDLNFPKIMAELRLKTYEEFVWPATLKGLFKRNGRTVALTASLSTLLVVLLTFLSRDNSVFFGVHVEDGSFYELIPYMAMVLPFSALGIAVLACLIKSVGIFWLKTGGQPGELLNIKAHLQAISDVLQLRYLDGGGQGCNYPDDRFSMIRRYFHHGIFYGFLLCLISTTIAASYDHFLHLPAPYPLLSWPVVLGTLGGLSLSVGTGGMLFLKLKMDHNPSTPETVGMDVSFTTLLFLTALTGLLLLFFRATPLMGLLLTIHLGLVIGFFITMPFGKFLHVVYRYVALVKNAVEQAKDCAIRPKISLISKLKAFYARRNGANK